MARSRNIKPGFFNNDLLAEIPALGRLLFIGLWTIADRDGRLEDRPKKIKAQVLPYDECDVDSLLEWLASRGFILRYSVSDMGFIQVKNWAKHQQPHIKEVASSIPAPDKHGAGTVQELDKPGTGTEQESLIPDSLNLIPDSLVLPTPAGAVAPLPRGRGKRGQWKLNFDVDVVEAMGKIIAIWPNSSRSQPRKGETVPASKPPEVAKRLQLAKNNGMDLGICVAIAERFVEEFERGGMWAKAAENFFGLSEEAPWHSYYAGEVYNRTIGTTSQEVPHAS